MRRHTRNNIWRALILAGIEGADRGPNVSDDIQLTYSMGDLSLLLPPLPGLTCYLLHGKSAVAAVYSGVTIAPPADSAILVTYLKNTCVAAMEMHLAFNFPMTANTGVTAPDFITGGDASRCIITTGTAASGGGGFGIAQGAEVPAGFLPIRVDPGDILSFTGQTANTLASWECIWREVPNLPTGA